MAKYEVYYSYTVDARAVVDASDREAASSALTEVWYAKSHGIELENLAIEEFIESTYDLDIAYAKRR